MSLADALFIFTRAAPAADLDTGVAAGGCAPDRVFEAVEGVTGFARAVDGIDLPGEVTCASAGCRSFSSF